MPIDVDSIFVVIDAMPRERQELLVLLGELDEADWDRPTECPSYSVKGIATHILGDDLSLLSRQRDGAVQGPVLVAETMPGADFRTLLDAFNDQWVEAARFLSPALLTELLRLSGEWSVQYYRDVDPSCPGEPVPMFGPRPDSRLRSGRRSPVSSSNGGLIIHRFDGPSVIRRSRRCRFSKSESRSSPQSLGSRQFLQHRMARSGPLDRSCSETRNRRPTF